MPDRYDNPLGDWVEARAELAAEMPEVADRPHDHGWTLEVAGIDPTALSTIGQAALHHVSSSGRTVVEGVRELVAAARHVGYEEGFRDAQLEDDDEVLVVGQDDDLDPPF
jgi:hypothetical protein